MKTGFCDSSALVKLVLDEPESTALKRSLDGYSRRVTSALSIVEASRVVRRRSPEIEVWAHRLFRYVETIALDAKVLNLAALLDPPQVRSMDAVQLASALRISAFDLDFIAYDKRTLQAAARAGLRTLSPV